MLTELLSAVFSNMLYFTLHLQNGSSFPKPLTAAEEKRCFERMKSGEKEAEHREDHPHGRGGRHRHEHDRL